MKKLDTPGIDLLVIRSVAQTEFQFFSRNFAGELLLFLNFLLCLRNKLLIHKHPKLIDNNFANCNIHLLVLWNNTENVFDFLQLRIKNISVVELGVILSHKMLLFLFAWFSTHFLDKSCEIKAGNGLLHLKLIYDKLYRSVDEIVACLMKDQDWKSRSIKYFFITLVFYYYLGGFQSLSRQIKRQLFYIYFFKVLDIDELFFLLLLVIFWILSVSFRRFKLNWLFLLFGGLPLFLSSNGRPFSFLDLFDPLPYKVQFSAQLNLLLSYQVLLLGYQILLNPFLLLLSQFLRGLTPRSAHRISLLLEVGSNSCISR